MFACTPMVLVQGTIPASLQGRVSCSPCGCGCDSQQAQLDESVHAAVVSSVGMQAMESVCNGASTAFATLMRWLCLRVLWGGGASWHRQLAAAQVLAASRSAGSFLGIVLCEGGLCRRW